MLNLAPSFLRDRDHVADRLRRERGMREQRHWHRCDQPDRREVLARIEAGIGIEARIDGDRAGMAEEQGVAVRRALDEGPGADQAGAAGAVVHHDLLTQRDRKLFRHDAGHGVDAAARRIGHDQRDGPGGIVLGEGAGTNTKSDRSHGCSLQKICATLPSPFLFSWTRRRPDTPERRPSQPHQLPKLAQILNERACPPAVARFRPSPATCDVSTLRSRDRRSMDGPGLRRFPLPGPDAVFPVPQDALVWTCWGVLLTSDSCLTF